MKWRIATLTAAMLVGAALPARAGVISTLEATYDGIKFNTFFTFANTGAVTETDVTISTSLAGVLSPSSIDLGDLLPGHSTTYAFNGIDGGFLVDPVEAGVPDTTTYQYSLGFEGSTLHSNVFGPPDNLTGGDVDFLGNDCRGFGPCSDALSGVVADVVVPEPGSMTLCASGLVMLALWRRRPVAAA
jgi:hypothetical protein